MPKEGETYIQDIPAEPRERLRSEILDNVEYRRKESNQWFDSLTKYVAIVYSGGTIAILSFIASRKDGQVPDTAIVSLALLIASVLSLAVLLYLHYQLHAARYADYGRIADDFFTRQASIEDILNAGQMHQTRWLYKLLFWIPFGLAVFGFAFGVAAAFSLK